MGFQYVLERLIFLACRKARPDIIINETKEMR
nr:MAG TPA: hypothetical protein [Caudoviricetes sp.]